MSPVKGSPLQTRKRTFTGKEIPGLMVLDFWKEVSVCYTTRSRVYCMVT